MPDFSLGPESINDLFARFQRTAFRLETFDYYHVDDEQPLIKAWMSGATPPPDPYQAAWLRIVRDAVAAGKTMQRVHIVTEPLSEYVHWELGFQGASVAAGEDILLLPHSGAVWPKGIMRLDWWLFDDEWAAVLRITDGVLRGIEITASQPVIAHCQRERDIALAGAVPYADYVARHPWITVPPGV